MKIVRTFLLFIFLPGSLWAQGNRYFVSFKDKTNTPFSITDPLKFISQKSVDRRQQEGFITDSGIVATEDDLPVDTAYIHQVKSTGASVFFSSRWFNGVLVQTDPTTALAIQALPFVKSVKLVAPGSKFPGGRMGTVAKTETLYGPKDLADGIQLQMIGLDLMHAAGYHGEGIDIAVFDSGFPGVNTFAGFRPVIQEGRLLPGFDFVTNSHDVFKGDDHGTQTLSLLAGNIPGSFLGAAYKSNFALYITEDPSSEYLIEEYNWLFAAEKADSAGVWVINSSVGYTQFDDPAMNHSFESLDGETTVVSIAARMAVVRGISVVCSAGNYGSTLWHYVSAPADAKGVIAVGAVDIGATRAAFSSVGPTADGRIKPDVCALGVRNVLFSSTGCCFYNNGTSFASPLIAGLVADLRQQYPLESSASIYSRLIKSSSQYNHPDSLMGYGIPNLRGISIDLGAPVNIEMFPNPVSDSLKVTWNGTSQEVVTLSILNNAGQKVSDYTVDTALTSNPFVIDFSTFVSGLYYVRATRLGKTFTQRISKRN